MTFPAPLANVLNDFQLQDYPTVTGIYRPITAHSLIHFAGSLLWIGLLYLSFIGWGRAAARLLRVPHLPPSIACAVGMAAVIFLGGWLNLFHLIYPWMLFTLAAVGLLSYFLLRRQRPEAYRWSTFWRQASTWSRLLLVVAIVILLLRVAGTVRLGDFNTFDDSPAYLVFPQKLLASHHFASDPFSDRRVISSLGGAYFLQSFVLAATSLSNIGMADRTLGFLLLAVALFDLGMSMELSAFQIALMEFLVYLVPQETINLTFVILPTSLLLTMIWLIWQSVRKNNAEDFKGPILAGLVGGLIISLKSTYLPIVGAYAAIPYLSAFWRRGFIKSIRLPIIAGLGSLFILLAWMIAMKQTTGTLLFPVLGPGTDYSAYGLFQSVPRFTTHRAVIKVFLQALVLVVLICVAAVTRPREVKSRFGIAILAASALAITAFNYKSGGDFIWRYNFPQFFAAIIVFYAATQYFMARSPRPALTRLGTCVGVVSLIAMIFYYDASGHNPTPFRQMLSERKGYMTALRISLSGTKLENAAIRQEYAAAEASIPPGQVAAENVAYPFLFNNSKRKIYLMDWPGAASPRPGWPLGRPSAELAEFFRKNSVRYVIYDNSYIGWDNASGCMAVEEPERYSTELSTLFWIAVLANHQLGQLRSQYRQIYNDGNLIVLDLTQPLPDMQRNESVWALQSSRHRVCTQIETSFLAHSG